MRRSTVAILTAMLVSSGCSSYIDKSFQLVTVETPGVVGAECWLTTPANKYRVITPGIVHIERSNEALDVLCKKAQYYPAKAHIWSKAFLLRDAVLNIPDGIVPGMTYDIANNSVYNYPHVIRIPMQVDPYSVEEATDQQEEPEVLEKKPEQKPETEIDLGAIAPEVKPSAETMQKSLGK